MVPGSPQVSFNKRISLEYQSSGGITDFFEQLPQGDFQPSNVPQFDIHELLDPTEYCNITYLELEECLGGTLYAKTR